MRFNIREMFSNIFKKESVKRMILGEGSSRSAEGLYETSHTGTERLRTALIVKEAEEVVRFLREGLRKFFSKDNLKTVWINKPFFEEHKEFQDYVQVLSIEINKYVLEESFWDTMKKHLSAHYWLSQLSGFVGNIYMHLEERDRREVFKIAMLSRSAKKATDKIIDYLKSTNRFKESVPGTEKNVLEFSSVVGYMKSLEGSFEESLIKLKRYCDELCKVVELIHNVHDSAAREKVDAMYRDIYNRFYQEFFEGNLAGKSEREVWEHWEWLKGAVNRVVEKFDYLIEKAEMSIHAGIKRGIHDRKIFEDFKKDFQVDWTKLKEATVEVMRGFVERMKEFANEHLKINKIATAREGRIVYNVYERSSLLFEGIAVEMAGRVKRIEKSDEKFLEWLKKGSKSLKEKVRMVEKLYDRKVSQKIREQNFRVEDLKNVIREVVKEVISEHRAGERNDSGVRKVSNVVDQGGKKEGKQKKEDKQKDVFQNQSKRKFTKSRKSFS